MHVLVLDCTMLKVILEQYCVMNSFQLYVSSMSQCAPCRVPKVVHRYKVAEQAVFIPEHYVCLTPWCWALAVVVVVRLSACLSPAEPYGTLSCEDGDS